MRFTKARSMPYWALEPSEAFTPQSRGRLLQMENAMQRLTQTLSFSASPYAEEPVRSHPFL